MANFIMHAPDLVRSTESSRIFRIDIMISYSFAEALGVIHPAGAVPPALPRPRYGGGR